MTTFKYINKKHGQNVMKIVRTYESSKIKLMKVEADIQFIISFKKDNLSNFIPTLAKVTLAIKRVLSKVVIGNFICLLREL